MSDLFHHHPYRHKPQNVNLLHQLEQATGGFNQRIAVTLTRAVGTMWAAYLFALLAIVGLLGILGVLSPLAVLLVTWISQTFIQLVFLPILSVGQQVLSRHQELQAEETYQTTIKLYTDTEQIMAHLNAQDAKILEIHEMLRRQDTDQIPVIGDVPHD